MTRVSPSFTVGASFRAKCSYMTRQHSTKLLFEKKVNLSLTSKFQPLRGAPPSHILTNLMYALLDANANRKLGKCPSIRTVNDRLRQRDCQHGLPGLSTSKIQDLNLCKSSLALSSSLASQFLTMS